MKKALNETSLGIQVLGDLLIGSSAILLMDRILKLMVELIMTIGLTIAERI